MTNAQSKAKYTVGDYVVNHNGSVGIIEEVSPSEYRGKWYNGGVFVVVMDCYHGTAERHAELDDIMKHLPKNMQGMAILEYGKRLQAAAVPEVKTKYGVGEFVISKYENPFAVGFITGITPTHYIGHWYRDEEVHLEMNCRHDVIQRRATLDEWSEHIPVSVLMQKLGSNNAEEEMAMTTIDEVSKKVTVTAEEKEALDVCNRYHKGESVGQLADFFVTGKDDWSDAYVPLREMGLTKFIDAMTSGYELEEPTLDVGDRVVYIGDGEGFPGVATVTRLGDISTSVEANSARFVMYTENLRLATEEELVWHELGREVGEFRVGDRYKTNINWHEVYSEWSVRQAKYRYERGEVKGFHPASTYVDFTKGGKSE